MQFLVNTAFKAEADRARFIRDQIPAGGLFAGQHWRIAPAPFHLDPTLAQELETLGRVLLQFNRAVNLLYRLSVAGKQPPWVAAWLDQGKPTELIELQRAPAFKNDLPRVIRPDLVLTDHGVAITELDSVPGGIGLTAWLNQTYSQLAEMNGPSSSDISLTGHGSRITQDASRITHRATMLGGAEGMLRGFASIFGEAPRVHVVISEESATYRPEMEWVARQPACAHFAIRDPQFKGFEPGDAVYRFFELFDLGNVPSAKTIFELAAQKRLHLTPPPKPVLEEKMLFALLWNRNLRGFWKRELGESFFERLLQMVPYTWLIEPTPLPPQATLPGLDLTDWQQLKTLSQRERELILKVSGYSAEAWGARGVYLGSDLSLGDWSQAVNKALSSFTHSPYVLQRYLRPRVVEAHWFDFDRQELFPMRGRVRLCPYYFVAGEGDAARANLGGVLATICPADKKIIHGMAEAILAPCAA
jgi:hypothetical protein